MRLSRYRSIGELAELYPDIRIVMLHMGHGVYIQVVIKTVKRYDNIIPETSGMPMHTKIREAVETIGENRVVYGSGIPFQYSSVELQRVKMAGLSEHQLQLALHECGISFTLVKSPDELLELDKVNYGLGGLRRNVRVSGLLPPVPHQ